MLQNAVNLVRGLICEAVFDGSKFRMWDGKDKDNKGRMKTFRTVTHRFVFGTDNGEEIIQVVEWLPDDSAVTKLSDYRIPYTKGLAYKIGLRGLKEEGGVLQAQSREVEVISDEILLAREASPEEAALMR